MAPVPETHSRGIDFVTVSESHAVEVATDQDGDRMVGAVGQSAIEIFLLVLIDQPSGKVDAKSGGIRSGQHGRLYGERRTAQLEEVAARKIVAGVYGKTLFLAQIHHRTVEMERRQPHLPRPMLAVEPHTQVKTGPRSLRGRESRVVRGLQIHL